MYARRTREWTSAALRVGWKPGEGRGSWCMHDTWLSTPDRRSVESLELFYVVYIYTEVRFCTSSVNCVTSRDSFGGIGDAHNSHSRQECLVDPDFCSPDLPEYSPSALMTGPQNEWDWSYKDRMRMTTKICKPQAIFLVKRRASAGSLLTIDDIYCDTPYKMLKRYNSSKICRILSWSNWHVVTRCGPSGTVFEGRLHR